ncbi:hypothetical protein FHX39_001471 [Friedmanniella antarctica]|uniref:Uncharacterized protein n=1 Tax=Microlunatus antarcticus TaxID=53388 RepID=A0A7W5P6M7_9ACTN|nr:hypothetical protein [Microlunatus antarcticus]
MEVYDLLIEATGEVCACAKGRVARRDENGNPT